MKNIKFYSLLTIVIIPFLMTSCGKDNEDPKISVSSPIMHSEHMWGEDVEVKATFTDDKNLKSYTVMIGDVDGEHVHEFHFMDAGDIEGESYEYTNKFTVPDSIAEVYYLHFSVTDAEDKATKSKVMLHFFEK